MRFLAVFDEGRSQRAGIVEFVGEKRDARFFVHRQIGFAGHRGIDQFCNRALVHGRVLPDIEAREMKAETVRRRACR